MRRIMRNVAAVALVVAAVTACVPEGACIEEDGSGRTVEGVPFCVYGAPCGAAIEPAPTWAVFYFHYAMADGDWTADETVQCPGDGLNG